MLYHTQSIPGKHYWLYIYTSDIRTDIIVFLCILLNRNRRKAQQMALGLTNDSISLLLYLRSPPCKGYIYKTLFFKSHSCAGSGSPQWKSGCIFSVYGHELEPAGIIQSSYSVPEMSLIRTSDSKPNLR